MVAFVTLYEAYMGIEPHFNLRNYSCPATIGLGRGDSGFGQYIHLCPTGTGVDPNFCLLMFDHSVG
jgi:hypothetical protein